MADQNDDIITQVQERVAAEAAQTATPEKNQIDSEFVMKCLHDNSVGDGFDIEVPWDEIELDLEGIDE